MKKKDIRTKLVNALNGIIFELQVTPSRRTRKLVMATAKDLAGEIKQDLKASLKSEEKAAKAKKKKVKKVVAG